MGATALETIGRVVMPRQSMEPSVAADPLGDVVVALTAAAHSGRGPRVWVGLAVQFALAAVVVVGVVALIDAALVLVDASLAVVEPLERMRRTLRHLAIGEWHHAAGVGVDVDEGGGEGVTGAKEALCRGTIALTQGLSQLAVGIAVACRRRVGPACVLVRREVGSVT